MGVIDWLFREPVWPRKSPPPDGPPRAAVVAAPAAAEEGSSTAHLTLEAGGAKATGTLSVEGGGKDEKKDKKAEAPDAIGATVLKVAGAAAAGITATGFIVVIGAALFWTRFNEVKLPATQAVGLLSKNELLVQGAQVTIVFVAIALVAVLLLYFSDPQGRISRVSLGLLGVLTLAGIAYVLTTGISCGWVFFLILLALALLAGCLAVGVRSGRKFWPVALAVFVATLVYSSVVGILVVREQEYVQAVALLRGSDDAGLTGVYVTANDDMVYVGRLTLDGSATKRTIFDVPRAGTTFTVGPLESVADATVRSEAMLRQLIADRERIQAPAPKAAEDKPAAADAGGDKDKPAVTAPAAAKQASPVEAVVEAFGSPVTIHRGPLTEELCLVRFADAASTHLMGNWWTSCAAARGLDTVGEIREKLALPGRFQSSYDARIEAKVPVGVEATYVEGSVAPQCEHDPPNPCGHRFSGGGRQYYLVRPAQATFVKKECTASREDESPIWGSCRE